MTIRRNTESGGDKRTARPRRRHAGRRLVDGMNRRRGVVRARSLPPSSDRSDPKSLSQRPSLLPLSQGGRGVGARGSKSCVIQTVRRKMIAAYAFLVLCGGTPRTGVAECDCTRNETRLCADAIFVGEILEQDASSASDTESTSASRPSSTELRRFNFRVLRALRGIDGDRVGIVSDSSECGLYGSVGDKLLVYASREPTAGVLSTDECWVLRYSDPPLDDRPERELEAWRTLGLEYAIPPSGDDSTAPPFDLSQPIMIHRPSICGTGLTPLVAAVASVFPIFRVRVGRVSQRNPRRILWR